MAFDLDNARKAGVPDDKLAIFMAAKLKFDLDAAKQAGATDTQIVNYLAKYPLPKKSVWTTDDAQRLTVEDAMGPGGQPDRRAIEGKELRTRVGEGLKQLGIRGAEFVGLVKEGTLKEYTQFIIDDRGKRATEYFDNFGEVVPEWNWSLREAVPFLAARGPAAAGGAITATSGGAIAKQALKRVGTGSAVGGATAATSFAENEETFKRNVTLGTLFGGAAATPGAIRDVSQMRAAKGVETPFAKQGMELAEDVGPLKASQITGGIRQENLSRQITATEAGAEMERSILAKQAQASMTYFDDIMTKIDPGQPKVAAKVQTAFKTTMGSAKQGTGLLGARAKQASADFALVDKAAKGQAVVPVDKFLQQADDYIAAASDPLASSVEKGIARELEPMVAAIRNQGGKISGRQFQNLLHSYGEAAGGSGRLWSDLDQAAELRPARELFGALKSDLDEASNLVAAGGKVNKGFQQAATALKQARDNYIANSAAIGQVKDTTIGRLLGGTDKTPKQITAGLRSMDADEIAQTIKTLGQSDPTLSRAIQRQYLDDFLTSAKIPGPADVPQFAPAKVLDITTKGNKAKFEAIFADNPQAKADVERGLAYVQRIMMDNQRTGGRTVSRYRDLAGRLAQNVQSEPVTAILTAIAGGTKDLLSGRNLSHWMLDPEGVKALKTLAGSYNEAKWGVALGKLVSAIPPEEAEEAPDLSGIMKGPQPTLAPAQRFMTGQ